MAKFVLTTWAACLARVNPVSTSAKPACMKITRSAPITIHSRLRLSPTPGPVGMVVSLKVSAAKAAPPEDIMASAVRTLKIIALRLVSLTSPSQEAVRALTSAVAGRSARGYRCDAGQPTDDPFPGMFRSVNRRRRPSDRCLTHGAGARRP